MQIKREEYCNTPNDWQGRFGCSFDEVVGKVMRGNWLVDAGAPDPLLRVLEGSGFNLHFCYHRKGSGMADISFKVIFDYNGAKDSIRMKEVYFREFARKGFGHGFVNALFDTAIDFSCRKIYAEPGKDGAAYWSRRGFIIPCWPSIADHAHHNEDIRKIYQQRLIEFEQQLAHALTPGAQKGWSRADAVWLRTVAQTKDFFGLNQLAMRDDLFITHKRGTTLAVQYILDHVPIRENFFDLDSPLTRACMLKRQGFDIAAKQAIAAARRTDTSLRREPAQAASTP